MTVVIVTSAKVVPSPANLDECQIASLEAAILGRGLGELRYATVS